MSVQVNQDGENDNSISIYPSEFPYTTNEEYDLVEPDRKTLHVSHTYY